MEFKDYEIEHFRRAFELLDHEGDGNVTAKDLGIFLRALGKHPTDAELQAMVNEADRDGNGTIEFEGFVNAMAIRLTTEPDDDDLREAFRIFDRENTGYIGVDHIRSIFIELNVKLTDEEIEDIVREADHDNDGMINYEEFVQNMTSK